MKKILVLLAVLSVAGFGFGYWAWSESNSLRGAMADLQKKADDWEKQTADVNARLAELDKNNKFLAETNDGLRKNLSDKQHAAEEANAAPEAPRPETPRFNRGNFRGQWTDRMKDPAFRKIVADRAAASLSDFATKTASKLNLNPDQTKQFTDLLMAQNTRQLDQLQRLIGADDATRQAAMAQVTADQSALGATLKNTLGDQTYAQLLQTQADSTSQQDLTRLQIALAGSQIPLQSAQQTQLMQAFTQANLSVRGDQLIPVQPLGFPPNPADAAVKLQQVNDLIQTQAQGILTPDQLNALKTELAQRVNNANTRTTQINQLFSSGPATAAPAPASP